MRTKSDHEMAETVSRRRSVMLIGLGALLLAGQPLYFANDGIPAAQLKTVAWLGWSLVLLAALAWAGGNFFGGSVRALVEDEIAVANRARACAAGFWAAMLVAIGLYGFSLFDNLKGRESIHLVVTAGIGIALLRFGLLERRALHDA